MASNVSASVTTIEDIAALARKLAEREPYRSASGPEALLALATHLEEMLVSDTAGRAGVVRVGYRKKRGG